MKKLVSLRILAVAILAIIIGVVSTNAADTSSSTKEVKIKTSAFSWMCQNKIETNLKKADGVNEAKLNLSDKIVTVKYNSEKTDAEKIKKCISNLGYKAEIVENAADKTEK